MSLDLNLKGNIKIAKYNFYILLFQIKEYNLKEMQVLIIYYYTFSFQLNKRPFSYFLKSPLSPFIILSFPLFPPSLSSVLEGDEDVAHAGGVLRARGLLVIYELSGLDPGVTLLEDLLEGLLAGLLLLRVLLLLGLASRLALLEELVCVLLSLGERLLVVLALLPRLGEELLLVLLLPLTIKNIKLKLK